MTATQIKLRRAGGSISATLPKAMTERLHLDAGDAVFVIETAEGILLTPYDPEFELALELYHRGVWKYRHALRELAR